MEMDFSHFDFMSAIIQKMENLDLILTEVTITLQPQISCLEAWFFFYRHIHIEMIVHTARMQLANHIF